MALYCRIVECTEPQTEICANCSQAACQQHGVWLSAREVKQSFIPGELHTIAAAIQLRLFVCHACGEARGIIPATTRRDTGA